MTDYQSTDDMFASACYWQGEADRLAAEVERLKAEANRREDAWLLEVRRTDDVLDMYERLVTENSEFRAQVLRQAETIKYLQREVEHAYSDDHSRTGRVVDALQSRS